MEGNNSPVFSIIVPTRNNENDLIDCISSIHELEYDLKKLRLIIWDNNSSFESKKRLKDFLDQKKADVEYNLIEKNDNFGVYTSRDELLKNIGADTDFILSIDDDVILPTDLLAKCVPLLERDNTIAIIGPRTVYDSSPDETAHGAGFIKLLTGQYKTEDAESVVECDYVIGCCMLIKKEVIDEIGGFDSDYYTSHGEVDFCLRVKKGGYKVIYDPAVVVRHRVDKGGTRTLERIYYVYRNKLLVIKKNWPNPQKWIALLLYTVLWFPKAILDSIIINRSIKFAEIKTITSAMMDGWLNRFGKRR